MYNMNDWWMTYVRIMAKNWWLICLVVSLQYWYYDWSSNSKYYDLNTFNVWMISYAHCLIPWHIMTKFWIGIILHLQIEYREKYKVECLVHLCMYVSRRICIGLYAFVCVYVCMWCMCVCFYVILCVSMRACARMDLASSPSLKGTAGNQQRAPSVNETASAPPAAGAGKDHGCPWFLMVG